MMKFLRVMLPHCLNGKFPFLLFVSQRAQVAMFLFAHFVALLFPIFNQNVCLRKKMESLFSISVSDELTWPSLIFHIFLVPRGITRRDTLDFSEENVRGRRLSCLVTISN